MEARFSKKRIRKKLPKKPKAISKSIKEVKLPKLNKEKVRITFKMSIIIPIIVILILMVGIVKALSSINFSVFLQIAGDELQTDNFGHTNFLILGTGGKNHEGSDLTDTIMVISLDNENKLVSMISIPRDYYVIDKTIGNSRINEVYYYAKNYYEDDKKGLEHMRKKVEKLLGVPIHYWFKIDFDGFKEFIDALGGIDVYVEEEINDPYYPKDETFEYETFHISEGQHHLDGETALKYARSRKTTSDFDRARRQQQIIYAIKEKALSSEIILDQGKITEILKTIGENMSTNITVKEILTLGSYAADYSKDQISHRLMHDDPNLCGGFLYTPDRAAFNGQFVLMPAGSEKYIHWYSDLNLNTPYIDPEGTKIHVLNSTYIGGVAGETKQVLQRYCFDVIRFGNGTTSDLKETTYYYKEVADKNGKLIFTRPPALDFLQKIIPGKESTDVPPEYSEYMKKADLIIEIGSDYATSDDYLIDPFYYLPAPGTTEDEEKSADATAESTDNSAADTTTSETAN